MDDFNLHLAYLGLLKPRENHIMHNYFLVYILVLSYYNGTVVYCLRNTGNSSIYWCNVFIIMASKVECSFTTETPVDTAEVTFS